jgi:hypothetical protein
MCPLQNLAGVDVDDPVAPRPAASIGDATISSVGHRPSSIVAPNRRPEPRPTISLGRNKTLPGMSKGLIWLMFHALKVRQGPMEN